MAKDNKKKGEKLNLKPQRLSSRSFKRYDTKTKKNDTGQARTRKSRDQISALMKLYAETRGEPNRERIQELSHNLNLTENQVYKWFWDTKQKNEKNYAELEAKGGSPMQLSPLNVHG